MRSIFPLTLVLLLSVGCGSDEADLPPEPAPDDSIAQAAPTFCDEGELVIIEEELGDGPEAGPENTVVVNYEGRFENGEVFDSGQSIELPLADMVPGFREGIAGMKVGGRRGLSIPPTMGYGPDGRRNPDGSVGIPPCATLVFDVELLEIVR